MPAFSESMGAAYRRVRDYFKSDEGRECAEMMVVVAVALSLFFLVLY